MPSQEAHHLKQTSRTNDAPEAKERSDEINAPGHDSISPLAMIQKDGLVSTPFFLLSSPLLLFSPLLPISCLPIFSTSTSMQDKKGKKEY